MNPYKVLGVSEKATDEQIRAAYLELVKKYHPDKYQDNPLKELAGEKLKEINEAYETITKQRQQSGFSGGSYGGSSSYGYSSGSSYSGSSSYGAYSGEYASQFARVRELLNSNAVNQALAVLNNIPNRNAEWNYLYGIALFRSGEYSAARNYLETAVKLDPNNAEYRNAYQTTFARGARSYHTYTRGDDGSQGYGSGCGSNMCTTLICADCCCECMGGNLIPCCGFRTF